MADTERLHAHLAKKDCSLAPWLVNKPHGKNVRFLQSQQNIPALVSTMQIHPKRPPPAFMQPDMTKECCLVTKFPSTSGVVRCILTT